MHLPQKSFVFLSGFALCSVVLWLTGGGAAVVAAAPTHSVTQYRPQTPSDCQDIIQTALNNISGARHALPAPRLNAEQLGYFIENGRLLGIDYEDPAEIGRNDTGALNRLAGQRRKHLQYLAQLANAYSHPQSSYYQDEVLLGAIAKGYDLWLKKDYNPPNWWYRHIGFTKDLIGGAILVKEPLRAHAPDVYAGIIEYSLYPWMQQQRRFFGANALDVARISVQTALFAGDCELLKQVSDYYQTMLEPRMQHLNPADSREVMETEGFQVDMNFNQHPMHGRQLYLGSYGITFLSQIVSIAYELRGTPFALSDDTIALLQSYVDESLMWMFYRGFVDPAQMGRTINRYDARKDLYGFGYPARMASSMLERLGEIEGTDAERLNRYAESLRNTSADSGITGNRMYWRFDYMVHRRPNFYISHRMTSSRTLGNEAGNGEGENLYYTGDGWNSILVDGDEYAHIYGGYNWRRIPGATLFDRDEAMPVGLWGKGLAGGSDFAGGCSNGDIGASAFVYERDGIRAHKAQFFFDWGMVALGADIELDADLATRFPDGKLLTTLNQVRAVQADGRNLVQSDSASLWHNSIGYYSLDGGNIEHELRSVEAGEEILWIGLGHPTNETAAYAYQILPGIDRSAFLQGDIPSVQWLNTGAVQSVITSNGKESVIQLIAYESGSFELPNGMRLSVDHPAILMLVSGSDEAVLYLANPYADRRSVEAISVEIENRSDSRFAQGLFQARIAQPQGFYSGQTIRHVLNKAHD